MRYTEEQKAHIAQTIRDVGSLNGARRALAGQPGFGANGPSLVTLRKIHRTKRIRRLNNKGGRPVVYTDEQREHMAKLAAVYGIGGPTGTIAILAANNRTILGQKRDRRIFPHPVKVSQPTITAAACDYGYEVGTGRRY